ncbi:MAG: hypothetical protein MK102_05720 [Fuerstiella sp.]|nr:hypothetical protein [Fuerstiella sp.]
MSEITNSSVVYRTWIPVLTPVSDSCITPLMVHSGRVLVCGSGPGCDLLIGLSGVSEQHCKIQFDRDVLLIVEIHASVWVNDIPVDTQASVNFGDTITMGTATFRLETSELTAPSERSSFHVTDQIDSDDATLGNNQLQIESQRRSVRNSLSKASETPKALQQHEMVTQQPTGQDRLNEVEDHAVQIQCGEEAIGKCGGAFTTGEQLLRIFFEQQLHATDILKRQPTHLDERTDSPGKPQIEQRIRDATSTNTATNPLLGTQPDAVTGLLEESESRLGTSGNHEADLQARMSNIESERDELTQELLKLQAQVTRLQTQIDEQGRSRQNRQQPTQFSELIDEQTLRERLIQSTAESDGFDYAQAAFKSSSAQETLLLQQVKDLQTEVIAANELGRNDHAETARHSLKPDTTRTEFTQRLQEARQQLELARVQLSSSIDRSDRKSTVDPREQTSSSADGKDLNKNILDQPPTSDPHSEQDSLIANIGGTSAPIDETLSADVCIDGGDSVLMRFDKTQFIVPKAQAENHSTGQFPKDNGNSVEPYLEQILPRNQSPANVLLRQELNHSVRPSNKSALAPEQSEAFIDQHMQQNHEEGLKGVEMAPVVSADEPEPTLSIPTREKPNLTDLRQDMDSFREISAQSVQKALESHAMQKERIGIAGRKAVVVVLILMTLSVGAGNLAGLTDYPRLVWGLFIGTTAAAVGLYRRILFVRVRVHTMTNNVIGSVDSQAPES